MWTKQALFDDPIPFLRQHDFLTNPKDCLWYLILNLQHSLKLTLKEESCICMFQCQYYRELTQEEKESFVLQQKAGVLADVDRNLREQWPWIVAYSLLAIVAFSGKISEISK
jgi:hypothetical protein